MQQSTLGGEAAVKALIFTQMNMALGYPFKMMS